MQLAGKVALVTGAGVRLGRAIALGLAERGARILVHYNRSEQPAQDVVDEIVGAGGEAVALQADLSDMDAVASLIRRGVEAFGAVDILVNSAAIFEPGTALDTTPENWERHLAINLRAPFFLCQACARALGEGERGHIVNIVDWRAERPGVAYMAYTAAKAGLVAMTKSMAIGLGPNIQVNAVAPGLILPPPGDDGSYFVEKAKEVPLKRNGSPDDVVSAVVYLLESEFVTGEVLHVTGGQHL